jgi:hypothetical protein
MDEQTFFDLSVALTGETDLDRALVGDHLGRLARLQPPANLAPLAPVWSDIVAQPEDERTQLITSRIMDDPQLAPLAKQIILLWYVGDPVPDNPAGGRTSAQYFGGILWRIARAHPPALSGGYFGHWTYRPDAT